MYCFRVALIGFCCHGILATPRLESAVVYFLLCLLALASLFQSVKAEYQ